MSVAVDLNSSANGQLWDLMHPLVVENRLQKVVMDLEHRVSKLCHFVFRVLDFVYSWGEQMFDAIHLVVKLSTFEVLSGAGSRALVECVSTNCGSTSAWAVSLAVSEDWTDFTCIVESNMRSKQDKNISVIWAMAAECVPSGLTSDRKTCESTEWEKLSPPFLE